MTFKLLILVILAISAGLIFTGTGIYFLSQSFLNKLNSSSPEQSEKTFKKNQFRAKGSGLTAIALGALTIFWGILIIMFPAIAAPLGLIYMIFLIAAFAALTFIYK